MGVTKLGTLMNYDMGFNSFYNNDSSPLSKRTGIALRLNELMESNKGYDKFLANALAKNLSIILKKDYGIDIPQYQFDISVELDEYHEKVNLTIKVIGDHTPAVIKDIIEEEFGDVYVKDNPRRDVISQRGDAYGPGGIKIL